MPAFVALLSTCSIFIWSSHAAASVIEYALETRTTVAYGSLPAGSALDVTFRYDAAQPNLVLGSPNNGAYDLLSLDVSAGGETASFVSPIPGTGSLGILNATDPSEDDRLSLIGITGATFVASTGSIGGLPVSYLQINIFDGTDSIFSGDALPSTGLEPGDFTSLAGLLADRLTTDQTPLDGLTTLSGQVVPEPSARLLFALGSLVLAAAFGVVGPARRRA